uniref:Uncharacterized protein n=1 Tax=Acrobeloides nanus TaxID=290746 RepID=A0A914CB00_9BILA
MKPCKKTSKKTKTIPPVSTVATLTSPTTSQRKQPPEWIRLTLSSTTAAPLIKPETPTIKPHTSSRWVKLETVKPYTFRPRYITETRLTTKGKVEEITTTSTKSEVSTTKESSLNWVRIYELGMEFLTRHLSISKNF